MFQFSICTIVTVLTHLTQTFFTCYIPYKSDEFHFMLHLRESSFCLLVYYIYPKDRIASPRYTMLLSQGHPGESLSINLWRFGFSFSHFKTPHAIHRVPVPMVALVSWSGDNPLRSAVYSRRIFSSKTFNNKLKL